MDIKIFFGIVTKKLSNFFLDNITCLTCLCRKKRFQGSLEHTGMVTQLIQEAKVVTGEI